MTTLEQAIHERWVADAALTAILPADRVTTGRSSRSKVPYVTILRERTRTSVRSNAGGSVEETTLRMNIWHTNYDASRSLLEQILTVFDRSSFSLSDGGRVLHMRRVQELTQQHADGSWQLSVRFLVQIAPAGV